MQVAAAPPPATGFYTGTKPVYAHLESGSGGSWVFGTITESDTQPADGYLVRLNDLAPAFDIRTAECEAQAYPANHKCNPTQPFRDKNVGVVSKIISGGIAAGTGGKVTELTGNYTTTFDEPAFNRAVDEALTNTGLVDDRRRLIRLQEDYERRSAEGLARLRELRVQATADGEDIASLRVRYSPVIDGLRDYYDGGIDFDELVRLEPMRGARRTTEEPTFESLLPCDARLCLEKAKRLTADLEETLAVREAALQAESADPDMRYRLVCDAERYADYLLRIECPETLSRREIESQPIPVRLTILGRDFEALYPDMRFGDDSLAVQISDGTIRLRNLTGSYLTVTMQSVYYNSRVESIPGRQDIAPGVTVEHSIRETASPALRIESRYEAMTPDKAERTTLRFGYAVRYRLSGDATGHTLHDLRSFVAGCVISNRLRPGSCTDRGESELATGEERPAAEPAPPSNQVGQPLPNP